MVGRGIRAPGCWARWGKTGLVWCGLVVIGQVGFCEEAKPAQEAPAKEAATVPAEVPAVTFTKTENKDPGEDAAERAALEEAFRSFAKAFNSHKADEVAAHYTEHAELVDQAGKITRGRATIQEVLAKLFETSPEIKIQMEVQSIRFLSPILAVEDGFSTMTSGTAEAPLMHRDRYTVTHIKQDGKWLMASARDWAPTPLTGQEQLQQLAWLEGEWVDENSDTVVHTQYYWSEDKRYLFSKYAVQRSGQAPAEGLQRIGWDPHVQQLRSWTFDTIGGFSEALWSRAGDQWIIKRTGTTADGKVRSTTNVLTRLGPDHATYQSRDRIVGNEVLPDLAPVPIVRKAPMPSVPRAVEKAAQKAESKDTESK